MICFTCSFLFVSGEQKQTSNGQRNLDYGGHHSIVEIHTHEQCCKLILYICSMADHSVLAMS